MTRLMPVVWLLVSAGLGVNLAHRRGIALGVVGAVLTSTLFIGPQWRVYRRRHRQHRLRRSPGWTVKVTARPIIDFGLAAILIGTLSFVGFAAYTELSLHVCVFVAAAIASGFAVIAAVQRAVRFRRNT